MNGNRTIGDIRFNVRQMTDAYWDTIYADSTKIKDAYPNTTSISVTVDKPSSWWTPGAVVVTKDVIYFAPGPVRQEPKQGTKPAAQQPATTRSYKGVTTTKGYVKQVILNAKGMDFRLFGDGTQISFLERVDSGAGGKNRLVLTVWQAYADLVPDYTEEALVLLEAHSIGEVEVNSKGNTDTYTIDQLRGML